MNRRHDPDWVIDLILVTLLVLVGVGLGVLIGMAFSEL